MRYVNWFIEGAKAMQMGSKRGIPVRSIVWAWWQFRPWVQ